MSKPFKIPESVLVVIHTVDLEVLLIERADKEGFWQSVTGSKDTLEESLTDTAVREVWEETGIIVGGTLATDVPGATAATQKDAVKTNLVPKENLRDWQLSNIYEIYPVWRHRYAPGVTHNTEHVFGLLVPRDIVIILSPREHSRYVWLPYREAAQQCFSSSNAEAILQLPRQLGTIKKPNAN